jgi:CubicO group peptidase (beta-lactamase class C family)
MQKSIGAILLIFLSQFSFSQPIHDFPDIKHLADSIQAIVKQQNISGLVVGITNRDSVLFSGGFGYADIRAGRPVTGKTLFRMASITKMFLSLAILNLVQEGRMSLSDELRKIAPEVPFQNKWESTDPVRIINLLEHTAGFDDIKLNHFCSQDTSELTTREMMLLQKNSMICRWRPGERFAYSNPGYVLLGYIIEKLTGKSYTRYITETLLKPLGMTHSNFNLSSKFPLEDVKEYVVQGNHIKEVPSVTLLAGPAGALWSCSEDMVKFLQLFLNMGLPLFRAGIISKMETPQSSLAAKAGLKSGYALANLDMLFYGKYPWRGHRGLLGTCFSTLLYNRDLGLGFVLSSNGNQQNTEIENLITGYLERHFPVRILDTVPVDLTAITPFLGQYRFESPRNEISGFEDELLGIPKLYIENYGLYLKPLWEKKIRLVQTAPFIFAKEGANTATLLFTKNKEGKNVAIIDGGYFEQTSFSSAAFPFWICLVAIFFTLCSFLPGTISLIACLTGRLGWKKLPLRVLPMIATTLLVWAILNLSQVLTESYLLSELTTINTRTMVIFSGTLLFAIISLLDFILVVREFRSPKNYWFSFYWLMTAVSLCYISAVLYQNGWIGLRTWAM